MGKGKSKKIMRRSKTQKGMIVRDVNRHEKTLQFHRKEGYRFGFQSKSKENTTSRKKLSQLNREASIQTCTLDTKVFPHCPFNFSLFSNLPRWVESLLTLLRWCQCRNCRGKERVFSV